jgi:hypothetical protein
MHAWSFPIFPTNGLDRSLHAPVMIGLVFVSFFTETYGWTYAGLVVPGYLAATLVVAPFTALLVLFESVLTHACVASTARIVPEKTAAWSTAFGRERFFLYVVIAIIVRLFVEGTFVPWATHRFGLTHSRELYSVGLVLVPLVANVFWSSGIWHSGPRLLVMTGLTYFCTTQLLLRFTNFSLSRFMVANESVALHFLDTPKAYILLLVGAMLGARGNVKYGWDYNGILVPALLAVAWYEPIRLLGTMLEAVFIYLLARFLASVPPFSRVALVGPRRTLFVGVLGFFVKFVLGHALVRLAPTVELVDYLGFGYILPSLLAVKMWSKLRIGIVVMPTLQVSLMAFFVGNALGFSLNWAFAKDAQTKFANVQPRQSSHLLLDWLGLSLKPIGRPGECIVRSNESQLVEILLPIIQKQIPSSSELQKLDELGLELVQGTNPFRLIAPKTNDQQYCPGLTIAFSTEHIQQNRGIIFTTKSHFPSAMLTALRIARGTGAALVFALSDDPSINALENHFIDVLRANFTTVDIQVDRRIERDNQPLDFQPELQILGELTPSIDISSFERVINQKVRVHFSDERSILRHRLVVSLPTSDKMAAKELGYLPIESVSGSLRHNVALDVQSLVTRDYTKPTAGNLRLLEKIVIPGFDTQLEVQALPLAVANALGYRVRSIISELGRTYLLYEPASPLRQGNATIVIRPNAPTPLAVEVPAPLWEVGTLSFGLSLFETEGAKYAIISGTKPDATADGSADPRRATGRFSYFQRAHEALLAKDINVVSVHGMRADVPNDIDVIAELHYPVISPGQTPALFDKILAHLSENGLTTAYYSASPNQVSIGAQFDPSFSFAERFAPNRMARLWFSQRAREKTPRLPPNHNALSRILDRSPADIDVAQNCFDQLRAHAVSSISSQSTSACNVELVAEQAERWILQNNPFDKLTTKKLGKSCYLSAGLDIATMTPWLTVVGNKRARIVPLHHPYAIRKRTRPLATEDQVRRALEMGIATIVVELPP